MQSRTVSTAQYKNCRVAAKVVALHGGILLLADN
jgi:hypothetical protein